MPTQNLTIIYKADVIRVHGAGCADIAKDSRGALTVYTATFTTLRAAAEDFYSDFIDEGSMTSDQAISYSHFLPCCHLPLDREAQA